MFSFFRGEKKAQTKFDKFLELKPVAYHLQILRNQLDYLRPEKEKADKIIELEKTQQKTQRTRKPDSVREACMIAHGKFIYLEQLVKNIDLEIDKFNSSPRTLIGDVPNLIHVLHQKIIQCAFDRKYIFGRMRNTNRAKVDWFMSVAPETLAVGVACAVPLTFAAGVVAVSAAHMSGNVIREKTGLTEKRTYTQCILDDFIDTLAKMSDEIDKKYVAKMEFAISRQRFT
jgi:hypothetical protein